jgi:NADH-quinone oxidoreductase subunit L
MPLAVTYALTVLAWPCLSFLVLALVPPLRRAGRIAGIVSTAAMACAVITALANWRLAEPAEALWPWLPGDGGPMATIGVVVDPLSTPMLVLVTLVSFLVQLYSLGYLHEEPAASLGRYYAWQSLFAFSMIGLVLAATFLQMFVFWELVGLCSYLLIGYWYERPTAARAAVKAFWITKLGDLGFVIGIVMLWSATGTFEFGALFRLAHDGQLPLNALALTMFLIYLGAVGKSAQFPLHVWLPDAMEGPTPVSALIHAATMVTAGVYMVNRAYPLFALVPDVLKLIAAVGAFTALLAATMACVESDIKRVLAYSTVSQLGFMMAAAGAGAPAAGFQHLLTHGIFKALLFLGAGCVIHIVGTNDIFRMGGLYRAEPWVGIPFIVATLALAGFWPLPGFFSKEAILEGVAHAHMIMPFLMLTVTTFLTAFYMFRVVFIAFFGRAHPAGHAHHVPGSMDVVCRFLAAVTILLGFDFLVGGGLLASGVHGEAPVWLTILSLTMAGAGFVLAWATYQRGAVDAARLAALLRPIDVMARRRYGLDAVFAGLYRGVMLGFSRMIGWIDRYVVDGVLNLLSAWTLRAGAALRAIQSGQPQDYVYGVAFGVLVLFVFAQLWR